MKWSAIDTPNAEQPNGNSTVIRGVTFIILVGSPSQTLDNYVSLWVATAQTASDTLIAYGNTTLDRTSTWQFLPIPPLSLYEYTPHISADI